MGLNEIRAEVLVRLDMLQVVGKYTSTIHGPDRNGRYMTLCFLPGHSRQNSTPSLSIDPTKHTFKCFGNCGQHGSTIDMLMLMEGCEYREALEELAEMVGVDMSPQTEKECEALEAHKRRTKLLTITMEHYHAIYLKSKKAKHYFEEVRGIHLPNIDEFKIGYAPSNGTIPREISNKEALELGLLKEGASGRIYAFFKDCIIFPFIRHRKCVHMSARRVTPIESLTNHLHLPVPKYEYMECYYNENALTTDMSVVVEAPIDALTWASWGYQSAGLLGAENVNERLIGRFQPDKRFLLGLDMDDAGAKGTEKLGMLMMSRGCKLCPTVLTYPYCKDANAMNVYFREHPEAGDITECVEKMVSDAVPFPLWIMERYWKQDKSLLYNTPAIRKAVELLTGLDPIERDVCFQIIHEKTGVSMETLDEQLADVLLH